MHLKTIEIIRIVVKQLLNIWGSFSFAAISLVCLLLIGSAFQTACQNGKESNSDPYAVGDSDEASDDSGQNEDDSTVGDDDVTSLIQGDSPVLLDFYFEVRTPDPDDPTQKNLWEHFTVCDLNDDLSGGIIIVGMEGGSTTTYHEIYFDYLDQPISPADDCDHPLELVNKNYWFEYTGETPVEYCDYFATAFDGNYNASETIHDICLTIP